MITQSCKRENQGQRGFEVQSMTESRHICRLIIVKVNVGAIHVPAKQLKHRNKCVVYPMGKQTGNNLVLE